MLSRAKNVIIWSLFTYYAALPYYITHSSGRISCRRRWLPSLISVQSTGRTRSSSLVTLARLSVSSSLQIPTALLDMHHLTCGISSLLHSVNLIMFTVLMVHLILRISPHHSHYLRSHHLGLSLPQSFTPDLGPKTSLSQIFSSVVFLFLPDCLHGSWTCTELSGHWRFSV